MTITCTQYNTKRSIPFHSEFLSAFSVSILRSYSKIKWTTTVDLQWTVVFFVRRMGKPFLAQFPSLVVLHTRNSIGQAGLKILLLTNQQQTRASCVFAILINKCSLYGVYTHWHVTYDKCDGASPGPPRPPLMSHQFLQYLWRERSDLHSRECGSNGTGKNIN